MWTRHCSTGSGAAGHPGTDCKQMPQVFDGYDPERVLAAFLNPIKFTPICLTTVHLPKVPRPAQQIVSAVARIDEKYTAKITELYVKITPV